MFAKIMLSLLAVAVLAIGALVMIIQHDVNMYEEAHARQEALHDAAPKRLATLEDLIDSIEADEVKARRE